MSTQNGGLPFWPTSRVWLNGEVSVLTKIRPDPASRPETNLILMLKLKLRTVVRQGPQSVEQNSRRDGEANFLHYLHNILDPVWCYEPNAKLPTSYNHERPISVFIRGGPEKSTRAMGRACMTNFSRKNFRWTSAKCLNIVESMILY